MAKKKKSKKREKSSRRAAPAGSNESRAAEAITVAWMLSLLVTSGAEAIAFAGWGWIAITGKQAEVPEQVRMIFGLLMLTSALTGVVCMLLIPAVYRLRRDPPPKAVTVFAVVASSIPILTMLLLAFSR